MFLRSWLARAVLTIGTGLAFAFPAPAQQSCPCCPWPSCIAPPWQPPLAPEPSPPATPRPSPAPEASKKDGGTASTSTTPETPTDSGNDQVSNNDTELGGSSVSTFNSVVGYIDNAIPGTYYRMRVDAAWDSNRPTRAEYFYPKGGPFGPGLPKFAPNVNYQIIDNYFEGALNRNFSLFISEPIRFVQAQNNPNHSGFGDIYAGFKYVLNQADDTYLTFQWTTYAPSGNAHLGLGTRHVSLEPALLFWHRFSDCLRMEGEFKYWVPVGGTDFAGDVTQYGLGLSYGKISPDDWWFTPVVEAVGWAVLSGKEQVGPTVFDVVSAAGDTIVNAKFGFRFGLGKRFNLYSGYGRALTGAVWYKDIWRTELRIMF